MTILPTCTGGPNILPLTRGVDSLSLSQRLFWKAATDASLPKLDWPGRVDVRDVAKAHVNALVTPEAAGKRWITSSAMASYSDVSIIHTVLPNLHANNFSQIADIVRRHFPSLTPSAEVQKVAPELFLTKASLTLDSSRLTIILSTAHQPYLFSGLKVTSHLNALLSTQSNRGSV